MVPALFFSQVQTRSADEPMTTFVLCNECGNRWKVCIICICIFLPSLSSTDAAHIRSRMPTAQKGPHTWGACQPPQSRPAELEIVVGCFGEVGTLYMCMCMFFFGKHPAGVGTAARILSQEGQVCHSNTDGISLLGSTEGRENNSTLHLDHASLQSGSTDGLSFEPGHSQG